MHETLSRDQVFVTVDILILTVREGRLELLLARRTKAPCAGRWALPGRFVGLEESAEDAVRLLLAEMLPLPDPFLEQLYTFTAVDRDPRGRVVSVAYLVLTPWRALAPLLERPEVQLKPFAAALDGPGGLRLTGPAGEALGAGDLAFDHGEVIATGIRRLRGKIDYTDLGFRFLNDDQAFSLSELLAVFEAVLARPMDNSNFRRFILNRYEETGRIRQIDRAERRGRGRPAALYRLADGGRGGEA